MPTCQTEIATNLQSDAAARKRSALCRTRPSVRLHKTPAPGRAIRAQRSPPLNSRGWSLFLTFHEIAVFNRPADQCKATWLSQRRELHTRVLLRSLTLLEGNHAQGAFSKISACCPHSYFFFSLTHPSPFCHSPSTVRERLCLL